MLPATNDGGVRSMRFAGIATMEIDRLPEKLRIAPQVRQITTRTAIQSRFL